jgi:membrane dipeptidase
MNRRTMLLTAGAAGAAGFAAARAYGSAMVDRTLNRVAPDPDAPVPREEERAFHRGLFIADLHADTLKWDRDMLVRSAYGHVDLPRLEAGHVGLQVFAMVTHSPVNLPWTDCLSARDHNHAAWLAAVQGRPVRSTRARAFHQIDRFHDAVHRSAEHPGPELKPVRDASELLALVAARARGERVIGGMLALEGGHWVGQGDPSEGAVRLEIQALHDAGLRVFAPVHRFDNPLGGSSEGCERYGLTPAGRTAILEAEAHGMVIDLAHGSAKTIRDAAKALREPFVVSHTGVRAVCEGVCRPDRNLPDDAIAAILDSGGVIGIGYWTWAVGQGIHNIPRAMEYVMEMADRRGLEASRHVALGSDFDGSVVVQVECERLDVLTATLMRFRGHFDHQTIADIMGRNVCRLFARRLPGGGGAMEERILDELDAGFV